MRVTSLAALLLVLASAGCARPKADFRLLTTTEDPQGIPLEFTYDAAGLKRRGSVVSGTLVMTNPPNGHDVTISKFTADCRLRRVQFGRTRVERVPFVWPLNETEMSSWREVVSGEVSISLVRAVCAPPDQKAAH